LVVLDTFLDIVETSVWALTETLAQTLPCF